MKKVLFILTILCLASCSDNTTQIVIVYQDTIAADTLTLLDSAGVKQIKFLDSLHKIGEF
jgi:hypothetical protein